MSASLPRMGLLSHAAIFQTIVTGVLADGTRECLALIAAGVTILYWDEGQIDVVVLGFSSDTQSASLHVRKYDADEFAKGSWVEGRHSLIAASFSIPLKDSISSN
jgi:hypothetical protein